MNEHIVLRTIVRLTIPFIIVFGLYIQFHGEYSPGGGFQAGMICAAAFIVYGLIYDLQHLQTILPPRLLKIGSACGALLFAGIGLLTIFKGGNFLEYSTLVAIPVEGQKLGILLVELGIGITVFSVMMIIFYCFREKIQ